MSDDEHKKSVILSGLPQTGVDNEAMREILTETGCADYEFESRRLKQDENSHGPPKVKVTLKSHGHQQSLLRGKFRLKQSDKYADVFIRASAPLSERRIETDLRKKVYNKNVQHNGLNFKEQMTENKCTVKYGVRQIKGKPTPVRFERTSTAEPWPNRGNIIGPDDLN